MAQDEEHLKLLSIFHYVVGGITALGSCMFLMHIIMGLAMLGGALGDASDAPPRFVGLILIVFPGLFMLGGWTLAICIIVAGKKLAQHVSRTYCLVVAAVECIMMPLGTVLGVFTIIVLMKDSVRALFETSGRGVSA